MEKSRNRTERAVAKNSSAAMFEKMLRAFEIGDLSFSDLQASLARLLTGGASSTELRKVLQRRELIDPLPQEAREQIIAFLQEAAPAEFSDANAEIAAAESMQESDSAAMSRLIEEFAASDAEPHAPQTSGENDDYQAMRFELAQRDDELAALQHQHSKAVALLEARARELAGKLEASGAAHQTDLSLLHEALATRDASIEQISRSLATSNRVADQARALLAQREKALGERNMAIEVQRQQHAEDIAALTSRAEAIERELGAAREELQRRSAVLSETAPGATEGSGAAPVSAAKVRMSTARSGIAGSVRIAGICAAIGVLAIAVWAALHRAPSAVKVKMPVTAVPLAPKPGSVIEDCATCPAFTVLRAGRFKQGSADSSASPASMPVHWVEITQPLAMSTNDVTVGQFRAFIMATGRDMQGCDTYDGKWKHQAKLGWDNPGFVQSESSPVTCASWSDANAYAQWLSHQTGHRYRLPSASEWEYAARAGSEAARPWNTTGSDACANANVADLSAAHRYPGWKAFACNDGYVFTAPVGSFKANDFGLNDMLGNVFQWTGDCWNADYKGAPIDGSARIDGNCAERELRGGSWFSAPNYVRNDYRNHFGADYRTSSVGFRLIRDLTS